MRFRFPLSRSTIHGQITAIILLGMAIVISGGSMFERWLRDDFDLLDMEQVADRVTALASFLEVATPRERKAILDAAKRSGWDVSLQPISVADRFITSLPGEPVFDIAIDRFFPPDGAPVPLGGWRTFLDGDRVVAARVGDAEVVVLGSIPSNFLRSDALGWGSNYLVALVTLIILFSLFAVWAITRPLRRIASAAMNADPLTGPAIFEEKGSLEIVALARALNGMRNRIATMIDARTRMLRGISHDLRTPLTRLRLRAERVTPQDLRDRLLADIAHIDNLLKESLSYLRDDHRRETVEKADLATMLQTICDEFNDIGHALTYHGPKRLVANFKPLAMTRAVTNLCENAVKFGSTVALELTPNDEAIIINVADDGPGIPEPYRDRVPEPFFKVDAARGGSDSGFGLGLSIVSEIVQAHGGKLELLDRVPHGLIARMTIPLR